MLKPICTAAAAAGAVAALAGVYIGMRDVMAANGGFCARGGPYVIGSECSQGQVNLLLVCMLGIFLFGGLYLAITAWSGGAVLGSGLFAWAALFSVLGWNFIELGVVDPPSGQSSVGGWIVSGVVFWLMALGGLIPAIAMAVGWARRRGEPEAPIFSEPLVRANLPAGAVATSALTASSPPPDVAVMQKARSVWFLASLVGVVAGIPLGILFADAML